ASRRTKAESVTHVSGTICHLCLGPLTISKQLFAGFRRRASGVFPDFHTTPAQRGTNSACNRLGEVDVDKHGRVAKKTRWEKRR
ncbi:hypothetical protein, partial [Bradyrhizobium campsiandrae]